jgi:hypothetical protein
MERSLKSTEVPELQEADGPDIEGALQLLRARTD